MKTTSLGRCIVALCALFVLTLEGCASYRDDTRPPITAWPLQAPEKKQSISVVMSGKAWINDRAIPDDKVQSNWLGQWRSQASKAFEESGLFSEVKLSAEDMTDLRVEIDMEQREEYSETLSFLLGFTFGLSSVVIPQKDTLTYTAKATFKDRDGREIATSQQSESIATWIQLFLVFAMPFRDGLQNTMTATVYDLHRSILQDIHQKHALTTAATGGGMLPMHAASQSAR